MFRFWPNYSYLFIIYVILYSETDFTHFHFFLNLSCSFNSSRPFFLSLFIVSAVSISVLAYHFNKFRLYVDAYKSGPSDKFMFSSFFVVTFIWSLVNAILFSSHHTSFSLFVFPENSLLKLLNVCYFFLFYSCDLLVLSGEPLPPLAPQKRFWELIYR